jgi:hypothetical protein
MSIETENINTSDTDSQELIEEKEVVYHPKVQTIIDYLEIEVTSRKEQIQVFQSPLSDFSQTTKESSLLRLNTEIAILKSNIHFAKTIGIVSVSNE